MMPDPLAKIKESYDAPIIENQPCPIPNLQLVSVFEKEDACEDPLYLDCYFIYDEDRVSSELPLDSIRYEPSSVGDAVSVSKWIVHTVNWEKKVVFEDIVTQEDDFPRTLVINMVTRVSRVHYFFANPQQMDAKRYCFRIEAGRWILNEE